jgi:hypothetical protein
MTTLYNLPDELLLPILDDLDSQDLDSLSKTSRRFRGIAHEALHLEVIIIRPLSKIPVLIRSMVERPDLAGRVRTLVLPIENGPLWPTMGWHKLVRKATRRAISQEIVNVRWENNLDSRFMPACVGLLLCLLLKLEELDLSGSYNNRVDSMYTIGLLKYRGGEHQALPGLQGLRSLKISMKDLDDDWSAALPNLSSLEVDWTLEQHQPYPMSEPTEAPPAVSSLTINCAAHVFSPNTARYRGFTYFISQYTGITDFKLTYTNVPDPRDHICKTFPMPMDLLRDCAECSPSAHALIERLKPLWPTLLSLDITTDDPANCDRTKSIGAVSTLRHFSSLERLSIPFWFLSPLGRPSWHIVPLGQGDPVQVLPSTLQFLTIYDPDMFVFALLVQIFKNRENFPELCEIVLESRDYSATQFDEINKGCGYPLSELSDCGICLRFGVVYE